MNNKVSLLALVLLMGLVLPSVNAQSLPTWIQDMSGWYGEGRITDAEFIETLQFLIDEGIIVVPQVAQIPEVKAAETQDLNEVWDAINFNSHEIQNSVQYEPTDEIWRTYEELRQQIIAVENISHDNEVKLQSERTVAEHTHIDYEQKYDQLMEMYLQLGERVLELEKQEIQRHDREIRSGEVTQ